MAVNYRLKRDKNVWQLTGTTGDPKDDSQPSFTFCKLRIQSPHGLCNKVAHIVMMTAVDYCLCACMKVKKELEQS